MCVLGETALSLEGNGLVWEVIGVQKHSLSWPLEPDTQGVSAHWLWSLPTGQVVPAQGRGWAGLRAFDQPGCGTHAVWAS